MRYKVYAGRVAVDFKNSLGTQTARFHWTEKVLVYAGENVDKLGFLLSTRILSTPHDIDRWMVCTKVKLPLDAVNSKEFTFGLTSKKLSRRFDSLTAVVSRLKDALNGLVGHVNEISETS